jgi:hypothetical protein
MTISFDLPHNATAVLIDERRAADAAARLTERLYREILDREPPSPP